MVGRAEAGQGTRIAGDRAAVQFAANRSALPSPFHSSEGHLL